jgi:hypothetical protein
MPIFDSLEKTDRQSQLLCLILSESRQHLVCVPAYVAALLPKEAASITADRVSTGLRNCQDRIALVD